MSISGALKFGRLSPYLSKVSRPSFRWLHQSLTRPCRCSAQYRTSDQLPQNTTKATVPNLDHRDLGASLNLFSVSKYSPGSPLFHPDGSHIFLKLQAFLRAQYVAHGFQEVVSPTIYKQSLWETSGHWKNYKDDMFECIGRGARGKSNGEVGEDESYGLKPMNCPGHCLIFKSQKRSYRDLPIRYADFSPLHRNEISGALSGLTRVRRFHQDDGHIFCRPCQVGSEIAKQLELVGLVYKAMGFDDFELVLSTRPEDSYIGKPEDWERAEEQLKIVLDATKNKWKQNTGDGAFYGPKIDIILKDSDGKSHQTATIQLDFQLPQRFDLNYRAPAPEHEARGLTTSDRELLSESGLVRPVIIHRAILGSLERFMALMIEHCKGKWPFWLSPKQAIVLNLNHQPENIEFATRVADLLRGNSKDDREKLQSPHRRTFMVDLNAANEPLKARIKAAKQMHYSLIVVIGPQEVHDNTVSLDITGHAKQDLVAEKCATLTGHMVRNRRSVIMHLQALKELMMWMEDTFL